MTRNRLTRYQTLTRKAAILARLSGLHAAVSDAVTTNSSYCRVMRRAANGNWDLVAELRASDHRVPGCSRAGWHGSTYDVRPQSEAADRRRLDTFVARCLAR